MAKTDLQILISTVQELLDKSLTGTNPLVITGTDAKTNVNGVAMQALEDTTFTSISTGADGDTIVGKTLLAGSVIYIPISEVKLATGSVIIYRHTNV